MTALVSMTAPRLDDGPLVSRVREPIPRGDGRRAWGGPALRLPTFPSMNDGPSSREYASRSPEGMSPALGAARRAGSNFPLARTAVLTPTGTVNDAAPPSRLTALAPTGI